MGFEVYLSYANPLYDSDDEDCPYDICHGHGDSNKYVREIFNGTVGDIKQKFLQFMARFEKDIESEDKKPLASGSESKKKDHAAPDFESEDENLSVSDAKPVSWEEAATVMGTVAWVIRQSRDDDDTVRAC